MPANGPSRIGLHRDKPPLGLANEFADALAGHENSTAGVQPQRTLDGIGVAGDAEGKICICGD